MKKMLSAMDALLRGREGEPSAHPVMLLAGALGCYVLYAGAAGFFQGGGAIGLAVLKIPLIILGSIALCIPSYYVFTALAGAEYSPRGFGSALAGFCGVAGLLLLALMPVIWLFSVSTISITFVVWLHVIAWMLTLLFARRYLDGTAPRARVAIGIWLVLLFFVSLQVTTYARPVLWRAPGDPLFARGKLSFLGHFDRLVREERTTRDATKAEHAP